MIGWLFVNYQHSMLVSADAAAHVCMSNSITTPTIMTIMTTMTTTQHHRRLTSLESEMNAEFDNHSTTM